MQADSQSYERPAGIENAPDRDTGKNCRGCWLTVLVVEVSGVTSRELAAEEGVHNPVEGVKLASCFSITLLYMVGDGKCATFREMNFKAASRSRSRPEPSGSF